MSDNESILRLASVVLLASFLVFKQWARLRQEEARRQQSRRECDVIDVAPLRPRLEALRRDYGAAAHEHARGIPACESLITAARRKISQLPFFRPHPSSDEHEHHAT